ncbi:MAG: nucleotidyltransferase family protein [Rhodopila sp.]|nr:nucleotidyltransferase family protein [Rhodopila sp.]
MEVDTPGCSPASPVRTEAPAVRGAALLMRSMRDPASITRLDAEALDDVLYAAHRNRLLARLEHDLSGLGILQDLPEAAQRRLASARIQAHVNAVTWRFEIDRVRRALAGLGIRIVLLKGAAYQRAGLPPARGRFSVDLDILVPAADIGRVEWTLINGGWEPAKMNAYDQHYYRDWMHQIPPLTHGKRGTELDVHHTIFPPVSGIRIASETLLADAVSVGDGLWVLSPADMVLHAATHLFQENPAGRLRDLLDLHDLLALFGPRAAFWESLTGRARRLGLGRPLYYSLRYAADLTGTAIPAAVLAETEAAFAPNALQLRLMDWLVRSAIVARSSDRESGGGLARFLLFARSHWIKMPLGVLLRHTAVKLVHRMRERKATEKG